jgi:hypothetical protein
MKNTILAVIDDAADVQSAVQKLGDAGVPQETIARLGSGDGMRRLDANAAYRGRLTRIVEARRGIPLEGEQLERYATEVEHGHHVVDVPVPRKRGRDRIVAILRAHGAHFINAYGLWAIEQVAA